MSSRDVDSIFDAWSRGKSALLYGPPGTGKTHTLSELLRELERPDVPTGRVGLDVSDSRHPFKPMDAASTSRGGGLPTPVLTTWMTFHQSLSYEDFVIGLRPESDNGQITLVPNAGALLDAVIELQQDSGAKSVVLLIDEINRGNAAKIFGEFLTFLDFEYRQTTASGAPNANALPLPIRNLGHSEGKYDPVRRPDGAWVELDYPAYFPRHVYVVATMNSVDRTAIPIDSALARRFDRIDLRPDLQFLANLWSIDLSDLAERATSPTELSASEVAVLILDRLNLDLAENFGSDFELGHGLVLDLDPESEDAWSELARIWDQVLFPQIEDRFSGRAEELARTLRVDEFASVPYAWRFRRSISGTASSTVLAPVSLAAIDPSVARASLQYLASRSAAQ